MIFLPAAIALAVTVLLITFILRSRFSRSIQDVPNERSLHSRIVPRTGGVGLMMGVFAGWVVAADAVTWWLVVPLLGLFVVSMLDDMYNLSVNTRLSAHLAAAGLLVAGSGMIEQQGWPFAVILFFVAVWMTDLYNFMDGSDGLAGGMALFGFGFYGIAAMMAQDAVLAQLSFAVAAAALGFLLFNFHPARIFMGDAGSIPLGFLAAALGMWGWMRGVWPAWFPLLVFSPFIVDASVTLLKRTLRGAKITEAHREHYYQRAVQLGAGHRKVALVEYVLMLGAGVSALCLLRYDALWQLGLAWGGIYVLLMVMLDARWKKHTQKST